MHENCIRDDAVVEAFEIIMRRMIMPRDAATHHYSSEWLLVGGGGVSAGFIFIRLHQIVASPQKL